MYFFYIYIIDLSLDILYSVYTWYIYDVLTPRRMRHSILFYTKLYIPYGDG